jgi:YVTN family beta-propeller protein
MKYLLKAIILFSFIVSCTKMPEFQSGNSTYQEGVFIINEGNFRSGNGSLSFFSYDSMKIYNDLFYSINRRPLGDVPNSITTTLDNAYIVVNNSGKIEVIDQNTYASKATINGLISPRNMAVISDSKAYVSSIYSDSVAIIDLTDNVVSGYINIRRSTEAIAVVGGKAYVSNWMGGKEVMVINTATNRVIDSITVGIEPESMVVDMDKKLWVLCNGGWTRDNFAKLVVINTVTDKIEKTYQFPTKEASPSCIQIDGIGTTIYYLDNGVRKMDIYSSELPSTPLIPESGGVFYKIGINPANNDILVTNAIDFVRQGYVLLYKNDGTFISKNWAGINPGSMCFKVKTSSQTV